MKVHLFTALCALSTLCSGVAEGQTSKPAPKPAKKGAKGKSAEGRLLFTVREDGKYQVRVHDFATGQTKPFLGAGPMNAFVLGLSPAGKTVVVMERGKPMPDAPYTKELVFRPVADPKKSLLTLPRGFMWPAFIDETTVLVEEYVRDAKATDKYRIHKIDLTKGTREVVVALPESGWDDVPLILSPDKKRAVFYLRGRNRGLRLLDLKTKQVTPILPGGTYLNWSPDSKHVMVFDKKKKGLVLAKLKPDGTGFDRLKDLSATPAIGGWLKPGVRIIAAMVPGVARGGMILTYYDEKTKKEIQLSDGVPPSDETLLRVFTRLQNSSSFVWIEGERRTMRIMKGTIKDGKVIKKEIASGGRIALPFSIP